MKLKLFALVLSAVSCSTCATVYAGGIGGSGRSLAGVTSGSGKTEVHRAEQTKKGPENPKQSKPSPNKGTEHHPAGVNGLGPNGHGQNHPPKGAGKDGPKGDHPAKPTGSNGAGSTSHSPGQKGASRGTSGFKGT